MSSATASAPLKIEPCGRGVRIRGILTVRDDSVRDENDRPVYNIPSHGEEYSLKFGGVNVWRRRYIAREFKNSKFAPQGIPVGHTAYLTQLDNGDFKATHSVSDITPEERTRLLHWLNGKLYIEFPDRQVDAARKAEARARKETYGEEAGSAQKSSLESMLATVQGSAASDVEALREQVEKLTTTVMAQQEELQRRRGGRPRKGGDEE